MRVVRVGGRFLAEWENRLWVALVVTGCIAAGGFAVGAWKVGAQEPIAWAGLLVGLASLVTATSVGRHLTRVRKGRLGERLVSQLIASLPDDYWLINDVTLDAGRGNIDHVLIGPCGVVVIETKRLRGRIRCHGDAWSVNGFPRRSISKQVNAGACAVRYFHGLRAHVGPMLSRRGHELVRRPEPVNKNETVGS